MREEVGLNMFKECMFMYSVCITYKRETKTWGKRSSSDMERKRLYNVQPYFPEAFKTKLDHHH